MTDFDDSDIAIIGMALRVPGASTPEQFWANLCDGVESLERYSDEDLEAKGISRSTLADPHYVKGGMPLQDVDQFDPEFFGFSAKEAAILDPQHRQFYEVSWEALERAGHPPEAFDGAIGVFAGCGMAAYFAYNVLSNPDLVDSVGLFLLRHTGNDKDFLSTRVSYAFNLKGPSINVQTACSTSLVAAHLAVQSLLSGECDMALAGGVTIELPHGVGYQYKEGEILSPDGHCRTFDHRSKGTVFGSGAGVVVLRRLSDAIADGDHVHAVIKGGAVNNDGSGKVGYLAPSVEGQAAAVAEALAVADVRADSIDYVECHGTGTPVGDPIEIAALTRAFRETASGNGYCRVGSVKSNIGHLDTAAGVTGLIKAALALEHKQIPPSLNFEAPNPKIEFDGSPFLVAAERMPWERGDTPRRAAVNSLGVGGTNAFVIVEEAPSQAKPPADERSQLLIFSARSRKALDQAGSRLAEWLRADPERPLPDAAYTLYCGRHAFDQRRVLAVSTREEAIELLENNDPRRVFTHSHEIDRPSLVFMYPGGGAQYFHMGRGLYDSEPIFRQEIDHGLALLRSRFNADLTRIFLAPMEHKNEVEIELAKPSVQLPLIFLVEYALTKVWEHYGVKPAALIGHSMGENTAACIAGVFSFEDALGLVLLRGQLMDEVPSGGMLSVSMPAGELVEVLGDELDLAAANSPQLSIASGDVAQLDELASRLSERGLESQRVKINIAAHSRLLDGIMERFGEYLAGIEKRPPEIPIVSNRTGKWLDPLVAQEPDYWVAHLRNTVLFADGIATLLEDDDRVFMEVGPGAILGSFTRQNPEAPTQRVFSSMRHPEDPVTDDTYLRTVIGRLWASGVRVEPDKLWASKRRRIPMPTYPFQHGKYWIEPGAGSLAPSLDVNRPMRLEEKSDWFSKPVWVQQGFVEGVIEPCTWLVFHSHDAVSEELVERLRAAAHTVISVRDGDTFARIGDYEFTIAPEAGGAGYQELINDLADRKLLPSRILHMWLVTQDRSFRPGSSFFHRNQEYGFYSLFYLARALSKINATDERIHVTVAANGSQRVSNEDLPYPDKATALGPCQVIPREFPNVTCRFVDVQLETGADVRNNKVNSDLEARTSAVIEALTSELVAPLASEVVAWRRGVRWQRRIGPAIKERLTTDERRLKRHGVYLITGGLGGIGSLLAEWLARNYEAKLVLVGRTPLPQRKDWNEWLRGHGSADSIARSIESVRRIEHAGGKVLPLSGDVTVAEQMREIVHEATEEFGPINGVFHAAGVIRDSLIPMKSQRDIEEVFAAKVYGTLVLDEIFAEAPPDFMVLFASASAFIAPQGQIDYVGANAFLNAFAEASRSDRAYPVTAINWGIWRDVGMVAPVRGDDNDNDNDNDNDDLDVVNASMSETTYVLFDAKYFSRDGVIEQYVLRGRLSADEDWLLNEHRLGSGEALLPGTGYLELLRAAVEEIGEEGPWRISNLVFLNPLYVPDGESRQFRIRLRGAEHRWSAEVLRGNPKPSGKIVWEQCATASITRQSSSEPVRAIAILDIETRCNIEVESAGGSSALRTSQEAHLEFGPRWRVLKRLSFGEGEAVARLQVAEQFVSDLDEFALNPALLDIATGCAMKLIRGYADEEVAQSLWVPISYNGFNYHAPLLKDIYSWVRVSDDSSVSSGYAAFDVTITDMEGRVLAEVRQLRLRKFEGELQLTASAPDDQMPTNSEGETVIPNVSKLTPGEEALRHNLTQGISSIEGIDALSQVIQGSMPPEIIVSSMDIGDLAEQLDSISRSATQSSDTKFERPELEGDYVAPRNATEKVLADLWGSLLGVEGIGINDSFFDLGGHSLIAVRLFNEIANKYDVDLPMSVLMTNPTIAGLAGLIGVEDDGEATETPAEQENKLAYEYVVPMHTGPVGGATPLFIVAGMFGNVLNLSHLAHLLGENRPFFALQARGLYGNNQPHETFEEMAADYITELRKVQPSGPYLLGGFSGGGITAFEMAHQLIESGETVNQLVLLDTPLPRVTHLSFADRAEIFWQRFSKGGFGFVKRMISNRIKWEKERAKWNRLDVMSASETSGSGHEFQSRRIGNAFTRAVIKYEMIAVPVDIVLFRPRLNAEYVLSGRRMLSGDRDFIFEDNGWTPWCSNIKVIEVPGDHDSMVLEPNVRVLVSYLAKALDGHTS